MPVTKGDCPTGASGVPNCSYASNPYINFGGSQYSADRCLYDQLTAQGINMYGFTVDYIQVTSNVDYDPIFMEDPTKRMVRKFDIRMKYDLATRKRSYQKFGALLEDTITCIVSKESFKYAIGIYETVPWWQNRGLTQSEVEALGIYNQSVPKVGDVVYLRDNDTYYEIVDFDDRQGDGELNYGHAPAWYVYLKEMRDEHMSYISVQAKEEINTVASGMVPVSAGVDTTTQADMALYDFFDKRKAAQEEMVSRGVEFVDTEMPTAPEDRSKPFTPATDPMAKTNGKDDKTEQEYLDEIGWS